MKRGVAFAALVLLGVLAGCSGKSGTPADIELTASSMAYGTTELTLEEGKAYRLVLVNQDSVEHDFSVTKIPVDMHQEGHRAGHSSGGSDPELHGHADPGQREAVAFTPTEAGTYEFSCTVLGHKEAGMTGQLVVN